MPYRVVVPDLTRELLWLGLHFRTVRYDPLLAVFPLLCPSLGNIGL